MEHSKADDLRQRDALHQIIDLVWMKAVREQEERHRLGSTESDPMQHQYHHALATAAFRGLGMELGETGSPRA